MTEAKLTEPERALLILDKLRAEYPNAKCALDFSNPLELLIATILAAQARDAHINTVTAKLFPKYKTAADWASSPKEVLLEELKSTGFFNNKTKSVMACTKALVEKHQGIVPDDIDKLTALPGVGRKTANVVIGNAFGHPDKVAVDVHVQRLAQRLGFSKHSDPDKIEPDLVALWPEERRTNSCHLLQFHGRRICLPKPKCEACVVSSLCPSAFTFEDKKKKAATKKGAAKKKPTKAKKGAAKKKPAAKKGAAKKPATKKPSTKKRAAKKPTKNGRMRAPKAAPGASG